MSFSRDFIEKVRDANNIVELFEEYTSFKRSSGGQVMGRCPLPGHSEKTPSFSVSEPKQVYHCFGCGKSGNIFDALQELKNLNFPEAVDYLASKAGIMMPEKSDRPQGAKPTEDNRQQLFKINKLAAQFFYKALQDLPPSSQAKAYASQRGLTAEIIEAFKIGFAPDAWDGLLKQLQKLGAPMQFAQSLGLFKTRQSGTGQYDLFRNRLMFPIQDHKGEFVGFGGRSLDNEQQPKYLNSSESEIFHKGRTFYGLNITGKDIRELDQVIVVEGQMDLLGLYSVGIKNVVATLGTAMTEHHAKLLKRFTSNVVILFDGDNAGQKAAERSLPILLRGGLIPKGLFLPDNLDPDDFVGKFGAAELKSRLDSSRELFVLILEKTLRGFTGSAADKLKILDFVAPVLTDITDQRLQRLYLEEVAIRIGVDPELAEKSLRVGRKAVQSQIKASITPMAAQNVIVEEGAKVRLTKAPKAEIFLLNLALMAPERLEGIWRSEIVGEMAHPGVQTLLAAAHERYRQNPNEFDKLTAYLMTITESKGELGLHLGKSFQEVGIEQLNKMQADCIFQVSERFKKAKLREITARMRGQTAPDQIKELEQIVNINRESIAKNLNIKKKTES